MNMNNPLENLRQLTEAVRMAGADIAPTYIEYVQLAFAIANDCGDFFIFFNIFKKRFIFFVQLQNLKSY